MFTLYIRSYNRLRHSAIMFRRQYITNEEIVFLCVCLCVCGGGGGAGRRGYSPSRLFHSFWAESIVMWGENGRSREKAPVTTHKQNLACVTCDPS